MALRFSMGLAGLMGLLVTASCGSSGKVDYNYSFSETGVCATGELTFTSLQAMCTALQTDSVNMGCALAARKDFFTQHCTGTFTEVP